MLAACSPPSATPPCCYPHQSSEHAWDPLSHLLLCLAPVLATCKVPAWAAEPPIEAVVFAWGASEDHQLGGDGSEAVWSPKVVESLLGVRFRG
jgi:hypothetical protein